MQMLLVHKVGVSWTSSRPDLMVVNAIASVVFPWKPVKKPAINVKAKILFIWRVKLSKNRKKKDNWKNTGTFFLAKSFIATKTKET